MRKSEQAGYYRARDSWVYLTTYGEIYLVSGPDSVEPVWRSLGLSMSDDAKRQIPGDEDRETFERTRIACDILE